MQCTLAVPIHYVLSIFPRGRGLENPRPTAVRPSPYKPSVLKQLMLIATGQTGVTLAGCESDTFPSIRTS